MTLCVAWKWAEPQGGTRIFFAADTCVTLHRSEMEYGGVKIAEIPVVLCGPQDQQTGQQIRLELSYGLGFSGEYLAAFLIRELTSQVLVHLQSLVDPHSINFDTICELVGDLHQRLHTQIKDNLSRGEAVEFFLGGYCPASQRVRVGKFFVDPLTGKVGRAEILTRTAGESFDTIGTEAAQKRFRELIQLNLDAQHCRVHFAMFRRLRDVILDPKIPSVGGAIQCGEFAPGSRDFQILGTGLTEVVQQRLTNRSFLGGTDLDDLRPKTPFGLHVHPTIALPFNEDLGTFSPGRTFSTRDHQSVLLDELITVFPHDASWIATFEEEKKLLRALLSRKVQIEHIGSTAVPGLPAVPSIDIVIGIEPPSEDSALAEKLRQRGYEFLGTTPGEFRPLFRLRKERRVDLHFLLPDSALWREAVGLRELLRSDANTRRDYGIAKVRILNQRAGTLLFYNQLKAPSLAGLRAQVGTNPIKTARKWYRFWSR